MFKGIWQGTLVALKTIKLENQGEDFEKEAEILAQLSHPNIIQVRVMVALIISSLEFMKISKDQNTW